MQGWAGKRWMILWLQRRHFTFWIQDRQQTGRKGEGVCGTVKNEKLYCFAHRLHFWIVRCFRNLSVYKRSSFLRRSCHKYMWYMAELINLSFTALVDKFQFPIKNYGKLLMLLDFLHLAHSAACCLLRSSFRIRELPINFYCPSKQGRKAQRIISIITFFSHSISPWNVCSYQLTFEPLELYIASGDMFTVP